MAPAGRWLRLLNVIGLRTTERRSGGMIVVSKYMTAMKDYKTLDIFHLTVNIIDTYSKLPGAP